MSVGAVAAGVGAVATVYSASQAGKGGGAQVDAANNASAVSQAQYDQTRSDNMAAMLRGNAAGNKLQDLLGLDGEAQRAMIAQIRANGIPDLSENWVPTQAALDAFKKANPQYDADGSNGSLLRGFNAQNLANDPIYQNTFQTALDNGNAGINRLGAAQGSLNSGATLKALSKFGANTAATYGNDAFNRFNTTNTNTYNRLAGVSGAGQVATNFVNSAGAANASTIGSNLIGAGNARAASAVGSSNAITGGLSSIANYYQQNKLLDALKKNDGINYGAGYSGSSNSIYGGDGTYGSA